MATRCQIGFFETMPTTKAMCAELNKGSQPTATALIYKHNDGMPDRILPDLRAYLGRCDRTDDPSYCAAWYLHTLICDHIQTMKRIRSETDGIDYLGHGIDNQYHCDLDFFYAVARGQIRAYCVNMRNGKWQALATDDGNR